MWLSYRALTMRDLRACLPYVASRLRYRNLFELLPDVWGVLLRRESLISAVVEDLDRPEGDRLLAFSTSVFLGDEFVRQAKTPPLFWIGPQLIRRLAGNESPILDFAAIQRVNSGEGLTCFTWEIGIRPGGDGECLPICTELMRSIAECHRGFRVKEVLVQPSHGPMLRAAARTGAWLLAASTGQYVAEYNVDALEQAGGPFVLGFTRELAREHPGGWVSSLFNYNPPRLFFTAAEQRLLRAALTGRTDAEIAEVLAVSISAVKKCWQSLYARVHFRSPGLLPDHSCDLACSGTRGAEKRRSLLSYLRTHPEELRPLVPSPPKTYPQQRIRG